MITIELLISDHTNKIKLKSQNRLPASCGRFNNNIVNRSVCNVLVKGNKIK